jgi:hypothetical protein
MTEPPKRSRLEDEVLEILQKADAPPPKPIALRSAADRTLWRTRLRARGWTSQVEARLRQGGWSVIVAGMVLAILANLLIDPVSPLFARVLLYVGVGLILLGFVQLYRGGSGSGGKMWRGKRVDLDRPGIDWDDKADQWRKRR